jgi:hypothetical protein
MFIRTGFIRSGLLLPVLIACAYGQGSTGTSTVTRDYSFPPTGLGSSETAQVNVLNIAPASTSANATAPSCTGTISFANAAGKATTGNSSPVSFTTTGSQIFSTQLTFAELGASGSRGEFVATVALTSTVPSKAPCSLVFSLETFDNSTYATHIFLGNSAANSSLSGAFTSILGGR